jgi:hypothetical protein
MVNGSGRLPCAAPPFDGHKMPAGNRWGRIRIFIPANINANPVIPAKAGIQHMTGCRIKSGMTPYDMFTCRSNNDSG